MVWRVLLEEEIARSKAQSKGHIYVGTRQCSAWQECGVRKQGLG